MRVFSLDSVPTLIINNLPMTAVPAANVSDVLHFSNAALYGFGT